MFLVHRPSLREIQEFLTRSQDLPLSYEPIGIAKGYSGSFNFDQAGGVIGQGKQAFARARLALSEWRHLYLGWVEKFPRGASVEPGTTIAILVRHFRFYSLNGVRVVYQLDDCEFRFGFAYGTLTNHAETGEEIFEVSLNPKSEEVTYRIRAASKPRAALAKIGYPLTRLLQTRFRQDSIAAMRRGIASL